jgi:hypothetical protein
MRVAFLTEANIQTCDFTFIVNIINFKK